MNRVNSGNSNTSRLILFEVLELPWLVLQLYAKDHPESHVAKLLAQAVCARVTTEPAKDDLRYWVTSTTLHRGVSQLVHGLKFINQIDPMIHPPMWVELARQGRRIGVFGASSSHAWKDAVPDQTAFYVPDKFAPDDWATPRRAVPYQRMLRSLSRLTDQGHGKISARFKGSVLIFHFLLSRLLSLSLRDFNCLMPGLGFRIFQAPRAFVSARVALCEFITLHKLLKPDFSLFVSGAMATAMHSGIGPYLLAAARDPSKPATPMSVALDELNAEVGMLLEVAAHSQATLVIASGYGQAPSGADETSGASERFCLLLNPDVLINWLGLQQSARALPSMLPCATLWLASNEDQGIAVEQLNRLRSQGNGAPLFHIEKGERSISLKAVPDAISLNSGLVKQMDTDGSERILPFSRLGLVERRRRRLSGEHAPGGVLVVHRSEYRGTTWLADVPVTAIAPTLIEALGARAPPAMQPPSPELLEKLLNG